MIIRSSLARLTLMHLLMVYVHDIVVSGNDENAIKKLKDFHASQFQTKDLGPLKNFLETEVSRTHKGVCSVSTHILLGNLRRQKRVRLL